MKIHDITNARCKERLSTLLRERVGQGKQYSNDGAADMLDVDGRAMRSYLNGENLPTMPTLLRMMGLFGAGFANRLLHMAGLDGAFAQEVQPVTDFALNAETARVIGDLGAALRDGRIDHIERARLVAQLRELQPIIDSWLAQAEGIPVTVPHDDGVDLSATSSRKFDA